MLNAKTEAAQEWDTIEYVNKHGRSVDFIHNRVPMCEVTLPPETTAQPVIKPESAERKSEGGY